MFNRSKRTAGKVAGKTTRYGKRVINYEEIQETGHWIGDMFRRLRAGRAGPTREETFANAYQRLGMDEQALALSYKYYNVRFYIFAVFSAVGIGIALHSLIFGHIWTLLMTISFLAICFAFLFQSSFRCFQMEQRELVSVSYWAQHPGRWIPGGLGEPKPSRTGSRQVSTVRDNQDMTDGESR